MARITANSLREKAKRDNSPNWEGSDTWPVDKFTDYYRNSIKYYTLNNNAKDLKPKVLEWMTKSGYTKDLVAQFKKTKDWRCNTTMGAIAACLLKGMPDRTDFNNGNSPVEWLKSSIDDIITQGKNDIEEEPEVKKSVAPVIPVPTIQDRVREQAGQMSEELDYAIDSFITNPDAFDPKAFKIVSLLKGKGAKAAHARYIKTYFSYGHNELLELASGNADDQLREAYKHHPRKNVRKLIEFYDAIAAACEQIAAEAKVLKKTRTKKIKPAEDLVKKLKFMLSDTKLGITSVPPAQLIGAQAAIVYNTKTRKLGYYIAKSSAGFSVKNSSLLDFTEKSIQKTLRKPAEQLKELKDLTTQRKFEAWFDKSIRTTDTTLNGRFNEDTILVKVFK